MVDVKEVIKFMIRAQVIKIVIAIAVYVGILLAAWRYGPVIHDKFVKGNENVVAFWIYLFMICVAHMTWRILSNAHEEVRRQERKDK